MALVKRKDLELYRGDTHDFMIKINGVDLNQIKKIDLEATSNGAVVVELSTTDNSIQIVETGAIVKFAHTVTSQAEWKTADYDLQLTFKDGRIKTILKGLIKLEHDITREV